MSLCFAVATSAFAENGLERGYRGFADFGLCTQINSSTLADYAFEFTTTHGMQLNKHFFVGGGTGLMIYEEDLNTKKDRIGYYANDDDRQIGIPLYADIRADILDTKITPFVEVRGGGIVGQLNGYYFAPSVGCRFKLNDKLSLNAAVSFVMHSYKIDETEESYGCMYRIGIEW